jgi:hypothetical protein
MKVTPTQIRWICEKHVREVLREFPDTINHLLSGEKFEWFLVYCTDRANKIEMFPVELFVKSAVTAYAMNELARMPQLNKPHGKPPGGTA